MGEKKSNYKNVEEIKQDSSFQKKHDEFFYFFLILKKFYIFTDNLNNKKRHQMTTFLDDFCLVEQMKIYPLMDAHVILIIKQDASR
jgi:hypothetical protein